MSESLLENYNPLYDVHLRQYFSLPHMQKHLRRMGLLDSNGVPVAQNGNVESELYARHHAMMEMMLKNRERILIQLADLQKKYDAAEKVEIYRKIRSGLTNSDELKRNNLSRSLSRPRRAQTQPARNSRRRASTTSFEDTEIIKRIETTYEQPNSAPAFRNTYDRLAAKAFKYQFLHKLDDNTLQNYKDSLLKQLQKLQRFRDVSFGPYSIARHQPITQTSWFFRRRSLKPIKPGQTEGTSEHKRRQHKSQSPRRYRRFSPAKKTNQNATGIKLPPLKKEENIKKSPFTPKPAKTQKHEITSSKITEITSKKEEEPQKKESSGFKTVLAAGAAAVGGAIAALTATHSDNEDHNERAEPESPQQEIEIDSKTRTPTPKSEHEVEYSHYQEDQRDVTSEEERETDSHHEEVSHERYEQEYRSEPEEGHLSAGERTPEYGRSEDEPEEEKYEVEHEYHEEARERTPEPQGEETAHEETHVVHEEVREHTPESREEELAHEEEPQEEEQTHVVHEEMREQTPIESHNEEERVEAHHEVANEASHEEPEEEETRVEHEEVREHTPVESHNEEERVEAHHEVVNEAAPEASYEEEKVEEPQEEERNTNFSDLAISAASEVVSTVTDTAKSLLDGGKSPTLSQEEEHSPRESPKHEVEYEQNVEHENPISGDEAHEEFIEKQEIKYQSEEPVEREEFHHEEHEYVQNEEHKDDHSDHQDDQEEPHEVHRHEDAEREEEVEDPIHREGEQEHPQEYEHEPEHGYAHEEKEESVHHDDDDDHEEPQQHEPQGYDEPIHHDDQEHVEEHREYEEVQFSHHNEEDHLAEDQVASEHLRESSPDPMQQSVYQQVQNQEPSEDLLQHQAMTQDDLSFTASEPDDRDSVHKFEADHLETEDKFNESSDAGFQSQSEPAGDDEDRIEDFERSSSTPIEGRNELVDSTANDHPSSEFEVIHNETPYEEHQNHHENLEPEHDYEIVDSDEQVVESETVHVPDDTPQVLASEVDHEILEPPLDSSRSLDSFKHHEQEIQDKIESEDIVENTPVDQEPEEHSTSPIHEHREEPLNLLPRPSIEITAASDFGDSQVDDLSAPPTPKTPGDHKDGDQENQENEHVEHQYESHVVHHSNGNSHQLVEDGIGMSNEHAHHHESDSESLQKSDHISKSDDEQSEVGQGEL